MEKIIVCDSVGGPGFQNLGLSGEVCHKTRMMATALCNLLCNKMLLPTDEKGQKRKTKPGPYQHTPFRLGCHVFIR